MYKKITAVISAVVISASMISCKDRTAEDGGHDERISVVTTIFPQYDFVRQIAGDKADVTMLLKPGAESHSYEPAPKDIVRIQNCDLFIYNGGEGDVWIDSILESTASDVNTIAMMDCVDTLEEELVEGMEAEEDEECDEDGPELDEHVWTSPENAIKIVSAISESLCEADPDNAELYKENTENYISELELLDEKFENIVSQSSSNTIVFGDRFPFRYFAEEYGLKYYAAFPGCSSESEPGASTISFLIDKISSENIPAVFKIEFSSGQIAETISEATGAEILEFHSCHNVTSDDLKNGETYVSLMNRNADNLSIALKSNK